MKTKPKKRATKAKKPRKQTSDRVATIAANVLRKLPPQEFGTVTFTVSYPGPDDPPLTITMPLRDLKALAASALGQDETRGRRLAKA